jgi:hypothetical protein
MNDQEDRDASMAERARLERHMLELYAADRSTVAKRLQSEGDEARTFLRDLYSARVPPSGTAPLPPPVTVTETILPPQTVFFGSPSDAPPPAVPSLNGAFVTMMICTSGPALVQVLTRPVPA